jgi:hypothetical protein
VAGVTPRTIVTSRLVGGKWVVSLSGCFTPGTCCLRGYGGPRRANTEIGRAVAQAVSRQLPTTEARVRSQVKLYGIYDGQNDIGAGFHRILLFPLPIFIPPNAACSSIIRGWYNRPIGGRRTKWAPSHSTPPHEII